MPIASFLPSRLRGGYDVNASAARPGWYDRQVTPVLQLLSRRACTHPIHTIVFIALLASTSYLGLLDASLFEQSSVRDAALGKADFNTLLAGSKSLRVGPETSWKWQTEEIDVNRSTGAASQTLALVTFVFPDSTSNVLRTAPPPHTLDIPKNYSAKHLPSSTNPLSGFSHDTTLAFSLPYNEASDFLTTFQEIPASGAETKTSESDLGGVKESKKWIMKAARTNVEKSGSISGWAIGAWTSFLDLIKHAESLDITIMVLGYLSMHLTFVSLFISMRRLGSNFWLAATVLLSSVFAFLFGLIVTTKLGVPINMVLLSEGLPFLVVIVGFEKPIILTKHVLSASFDERRQASQNQQARRNSAPLTIQTAVQNAVKDRGYQLIKDYCVEIVILVAGAASGVQGGLRQFCFLAAWILVFDCILLFTFYTAILTIKLEINRIRRHVDLRRALEDDGISRNVAENVATSNEWPTVNVTNGANGQVKQRTERTVFGRAVKDINVPRFKVLMVAAFFLINLINICTIPFRGSSRGNNTSAGPSLSSVITQPPMDPFKVAGNGLDTIFDSARTSKLSTVVVVLAPIKYELEYPSIHYAVPKQLDGLFDTDQDGESMGGKVVEGILKSLEDPVLSKWIIGALALSLVLNGYLFNAARWSIKDPAQPSKPPKESEVLDGGISSPSSPAPATVRPNIPTIDIVKDQEVAARAAHAIQNGPSNRTLEDCEQVLKDKQAPLLTDEELVALSLRGKIPGYALEKTLGDKTRAVKIRRAVVSRTHATRRTSTLLENSKLPYESYNYDLVHGACCENVIGYLPLPLGVAGPLMIDGQNYFLPMATTEGVLVASTSRGCKAINSGGGAVTVLTGDGMTRGPCVSFDTLTRAGAAKVWIDSEEGQKVMKEAFNSTSRFARLQTLKTALAGTYLFIRFKTTTGDAMGMNMISKGVEHALHVMANESGFSDMQIISVSGNYCTDKKPAAINWIDGRGKSVVAEAIIPGDIVKNVLKSSVEAMVELNVAKNLIGSAMAGSIGGFNAHAANILTAIFLATGQDPAQNVESSQCITTMKNVDGNLQIAVSMPCIEVGTIGGGTILEPQSAMLDLLGVKGPHPTNPGDNARQLARIIAAAVLAGELSLCAALAAGHLVRAHMSHNRSAQPSRSTTPAPSGTQTPTTLAMTNMKDSARSGR